MLISPCKIQFSKIGVGRSDTTSYFSQFRHVRTVGSKKENEVAGFFVFSQ